MMRVNTETVDRMIEIFVEHEGKKQALNKQQLYRAFFKEAYDESTTAKMYVARERWRFLRRLMKAMRAKSDYFVVCEPVAKGEWEFYVVKQLNEFELFSGRLDSIVKGIKYVQNKGRIFCEKRGL